MTVINGATGTGVGPSQQFTIQPVLGTDRTLNFQAIKTGVFTALTADLEKSTDGGTTFAARSGGGTAIDFQTTNAVQQVLNVVSGPIYRLNIKTFAGGTSVVINASLS